MARPRTASSILDARGAFKKHPERKRESEPEVHEPLPEDPPDYMTEDQAECWRHLKSIAPAGVLTAADAGALEMTACLYAEFRRGPDDMPTARLTRLSSELHKLGMNPSGRAGLTVPKQKAGELDDL